MPLLQKRRKFKSYYQRNTLGKRLWFIARLLLGWFLMYQLITLFIFASYKVDSVSMYPDFTAGNRVIVSRLAYGPFLPFSDRRISGLGTPRRGDVVILKPPYYQEETIVEKGIDPVLRFFSLNRHRTLLSGRQVWENPLVIKRVIGLPGDTIKMTDFTVFVKPAGSDHFLTEFEMSRRLYDTVSKPLPAGWRPGDPFSGSFPEMTLGSDEYFVMGDNRSESHDSRYWGPVGLDAITGKVIFKYWPAGSFGVP